MVYTTYVCWFRGWFIIVLATLSLILTLPASVLNPYQSRGWVNSSTTMVSSWGLSTRLDGGVSETTDDKCPTNFEDGMMVIVGNPPNYKWKFQGSHIFSGLANYMFFSCLFRSGGFNPHDVRHIRIVVLVTWTGHLNTSGLRGSRLASASAGVGGWDPIGSHWMFRFPQQSYAETGRATPPEIELLRENDR